MIGVIVALAMAVAAGLVAFGRFWQRHEHKPHWDELAKRDRRIERLRHDLAERDRTIATVVEQRNRAMENVRRLRDGASR